MSYLFCALCRADHELVGIFTTTVSVPSGAVVVMSCGNWICTGSVVLLLVTCADWKWKLEICFNARVVSSYMNGNFLRQGEMRNWKRCRSWHVVVCPLNTIRWTARRDFLTFDHHFVASKVLMVCMRRFFLRPLCYVRFYVLPEVILAVKAFPTLRTDLKQEQSWVEEEESFQCWFYFCFMPTVDDSMEIQMLLAFKSLQTNMTHIRPFWVVP